MKTIELWVDVDASGGILAVWWDDPYQLHPDHRRFHIANIKLPMDDEDGGVRVEEVVA